MAPAEQTIKLKIDLDTSHIEAVADLVEAWANQMARHAFELRMAVASLHENGAA
jgi:hypothetical protein